MADIDREVPVDDPTLDATDGAHPAWWRGHDHGCAGMLEWCRKRMIDMAKSTPSDIPYEWISGWDLAIMACIETIDTPRKIARDEQPKFNPARIAADLTSAGWFDEQRAQIELNLERAYEAGRKAAGAAEDAAFKRGYFDGRQDELKNVAEVGTLREGCQTACGILMSTVKSGTTADHLMDAIDRMRRAYQVIEEAMAQKPEGGT